MAVDKHKAEKEVTVDPEHGRKGKNGNWPGCTKEFANRTEKRRKKNKQAKKSRKKNRSK